MPAALPGCASWLSDGICSGKPLQVLSSKAVVLNWGDFAPHYPLPAPGWREHFTLSGYIFVYHNWRGGGVATLI